MKRSTRHVIVVAVAVGLLATALPVSALPPRSGAAALPMPALPAPELIVADPLLLLEPEPLDESEEAVACVIDDTDVDVADYIGPEGAQLMSSLAAFMGGGSPVDHVSKAMLVKLCVEQFHYPEKVCQNLAKLIGGAGCKALKGTLNHCLRHPDEKRCKKPMIEFLLAALNKFCPGWICR